MEIWEGEGWYFQPRPTFRICFTSKLESSVYLCVRLNVWLCVLGGVGVDFQSLSTSATMDFSPILRRTNCFDWEKSYVLLKSWWETNFERSNRLQTILSMGVYLSYLWDSWGPIRGLESALQLGVNELGEHSEQIFGKSWDFVFLIGHFGTLREALLRKREVIRAMSERKKILRRASLMGPLGSTTTTSVHHRW